MGDLDVCLIAVLILATWFLFLLLVGSCEMGRFSCQAVSFFFLVLYLVSLHSRYVRIDSAANPGCQIPWGLYRIVSLLKIPTKIWPLILHRS